MMNPYESPNIPYDGPPWHITVFRNFVRFMICVIAVEYGLLWTVAGSLGDSAWCWGAYGIGVAGCFSGFVLLRFVR